MRTETRLPDLMYPSKEPKPKSSLYFEAMVSKVDDSVGQVVEALHDRRMLNNSVIVFMSDNGAPSVEVFQNWGSNYPLRGVSVVLVVLLAGKQVFYWLSC